MSPDTTLQPKGAKAVHIMDWLAQRFELSRGGANANVRSMEGLRGFAVFLVFLVHYVSLVEPWTPVGSSTMSIADALHTIGNSGVDLFFVLSGYLIYGSLFNRKQQFSKFIHRRVERIYPAFTVVFVIYLCLSFVFPDESKLPADLLNAIMYLTQNFLLLPGLFPIEPMITVAWSLSYEMFYYLAIPFTIELTRIRERTSRWRITFFIVLAILVALFCAATNGPIRMVMFLSGILLFETTAGRHQVREIPSYIGASALVLGLLGMLLPISGPVGYTAKICLLFAAFFILCLTCFWSPSGWLARSFSWTPLRWLGNMSYSYYLLHGLSLKAAFLVLSVLLPKPVFGEWFFWALLPFMFLVTIPPTAALFLTIERPFSLSPSRKRTRSSGPLSDKA